MTSVAPAIPAVTIVVGIQKAEHLSIDPVPVRQTQRCSKPAAQVQREGPRPDQDDASTFHLARSVLRQRTVAVWQNNGART